MAYLQTCCYSLRSFFVPMVSPFLFSMEGGREGELVGDLPLAPFPSLSSLKIFEYFRTSSIDLPLSPSSYFPFILSYSSSLIPFVWLIVQSNILFVVPLVHREIWLLVHHLLWNWSICTVTFSNIIWFGCYDLPFVWWSNSEFIVSLYLSSLFSLQILISEKPGEGLKRRKKKVDKRRRFQEWGKAHR